MSVADQEGVEKEHLIHDGGSKDGTAEFVTSQPYGISEKDEGMYDAINRAWHRATGDYVLHLNGDEQILPGTLEAVADYFEAHPKVDMVIGGVLMCDAEGSLQCYRQGLRPPLSIMVTSHHPVQSCGVFLRRSSFVDRPWLYNPEFRLISDVLFMIDVVRGGKRIAVLDRFTSVFLLTGNNMGLTLSAKTEAEYAYQMGLASGWMKILRPVIRAVFQFRKALTGAYKTRKITYRMYLGGSAQRVTLIAENARGVYKPKKTGSANA